MLMQIPPKTSTKKTQKQQAKIQCRACKKQLIVNKSLNLINGDPYHFSLGINIIIFNDPSKNHPGNTHNLDSFVGFCQKCYQQGTFYNIFNDVHYSFYLQERETQRHFLQQADKQIIELKTTNTNLMLANDYLRQKNSEYETSLQKFAAQIKMDAKINSLKTQIEALEQKIRSYVQVSHKILKQSQESAIKCEIQDFPINQKLLNLQSENICDKTISHSLSSMLNNYSQYQIDLQNQLEASQVVNDAQLKIFGQKDCEKQRSTQASLNNLQKYFQMQLKNICYELEQQYLEIQKNKKEQQNRLESLKQTFQIFSITLQCSTCARMLFIEKLHYKKVEKNHFNLQLNFCIFNSSIKDSKGKEHRMFNTFQVFCQDCYKKGKYFAAFREQHKVHNLNIIKGYDYKIQLSQQQSLSKQKKNQFNQDQNIYQVSSSSQNVLLQRLYQVRLRALLNMQLQKSVYQVQKDKNTSYDQAYQKNQEKMDQRKQVKHLDLKREKVQTKQSTQKIEKSGQKSKTLSNKHKKESKKQDNNLKKLRESTKLYILYLIQKDVWYKRQGFFHQELFCTLKSSQCFQILLKIFCCLFSELSIRQFIQEAIGVIEGEDAELQQIKRIQLLKEVIFNAESLFDSCQQVGSLFMQACTRPYIPTDDPYDYWDRLIHLRPVDFPQLPSLSVKGANNKNKLKVIYTASDF